MGQRHLDEEEHREDIGPEGHDERALLDIGDGLLLVVLGSVVDEDIQLYDPRGRLGEDAAPDPARSPLAGDVEAVRGQQAASHRLNALALAHDLLKVIFWTRYGVAPSSCRAT